MRQSSPQTFLPQGFHPAAPTARWHSLQQSGSGFWRICVPQETYQNTSLSSLFTLLFDRLSKVREVTTYPFEKLGEGIP